jgi:hypothetical protein
VVGPRVGHLFVHGLFQLSFFFSLALGRCTVIGVVRCTFSPWVPCVWPTDAAATDCLIWLGCHGWEERVVCVLRCWFGGVSRTGQVMVAGALGVLREDANWVSWLGLYIWRFCCMGGCALCDRTQYI